MKGILEDIDHFMAAGSALALARVVSVEGSAPRGPGAAMLVTDGGEVTGSVSGGCVESAVVEEALGVISRGLPTTASFGYTDEQGMEVGLTCGGVVHMFIEPLHPGSRPLFGQLADALRTGAPVALASVLEGPHTGSHLLVGTDGLLAGAIGDGELQRVVLRDTVAGLAGGHTGVRHYGPSGEADEAEVKVFTESFAPPPELLVLGAMDFTSALVRVAKVLGHRVTVCDARAVFATRRRFPEADEVVVEWPNRFIERNSSGLGPRDAVCVLTHDPRFDVPAIMAALRTDVGYIGAMGSRRTHGDRVERLREAGAGEADLARIHSPIGLDLGASTPEDTAISILAELIAARTGRAGGPLGASTGTIH